MRGVVARRQPIGQYTVAAQNIYFQPGHEIWRSWVAIINYAPGGNVSRLVHGYLRISLSLMGPGDEPVWHDPRDEGKEDDAAVLMPPALKRELLFMRIGVLRAQNLKVMDRSLVTDAQ